MARPRRILALSCTLARVATAMAAGEPPAPPPTGTAHVRLSIEHVFGPGPLHAEDVSCRTAAGNTLSISRLSYLLSNVHLVPAASKNVPRGGQIAFINAVSGRTTIDLAAVPHGEYAALAFDLGVPPDINHADPGTFSPTDPLNPTVNNLHWSWQGGYVFLALEGRWVQPDDSLGGYSFHIATDEHLTHVTIPAAISIGGDTLLTLRCDAAALFSSAHSIPITTDQETQSTHSGKDGGLARRIADNFAHAFAFSSAAPLDAPPAAAATNPTPIPAGTTPYSFKVPQHFPQPQLPADNPLSVEGIALGHRLFNEVKLSANDTQSCASCHTAANAFADGGKPLSIGIDGKPGSRNAMPLFNLAWSAESGYTWDGRRARIRDQALAPIQDAREMHQSLQRTVEKLRGDDRYPSLFAQAFGDTAPSGKSGPSAITPERLGLALEQYLLTLVSANSKFDRALGKQETLTPLEKRGLLLFVTEHDPVRNQFGADCFHCHGLPLFTDHQFRSNGLDVESQDPGRAGVTDRPTDRGRFKTPSLRNVAFTAPYMHDGRFRTLEEVLEHYSEHLQSSSSLDPNLAKHILTTPEGEKRAGVHLAREDRDALIAFLKTLTDDQFLGAATTLPTGSPPPQSAP